MNSTSRRRAIEEQPQQTEVEEHPTPKQILDQQKTAQTTENLANSRRRNIEEPEKQDKKDQESDYFGSFKQGVQHSATGELQQDIFGSQKELESRDKGFWESVVQESGTLIGDAPFMAAGAVIGGALGGTLGTAVSAGFGTAAGTAIGSGFGALALPSFLKEASREYRSFQEKGGNLTFGEFLESADKVASKTLNEGLFGVILGKVKQTMGLLSKIPGLDKLFNTRYIGPVIKETATIAGEVGAATTVPGLAEGRLPTKEDAARAAVLFTGGRLAHLPGQLADVIKESRSERFNYALADQIQDQNLAYPPLQEFRKGENPVYKNSAELDRNLSAFDESYVNNVVSRINSISETEFDSADQAGRHMRSMLLTVAPVSPPASPATPTASSPMPIRPIVRIVPLVENPLQQAINTISPEAAPSKAELGRRVIGQYRAGRQAEYQPLRERYTQQRQDVAGIEIVNNTLPEEIQGFIDRFEGSAIPGSESSKIVTNANRIRDLFIQRDGKGNEAGNRPVRAQQLIATNRALKEIPNWDVPPEMKQNLATLTTQIDQAIEGHLRNFNEDLADEYVNLNRDYAQFKNRWDNNDMRIFYDRTESSEKVADRFTNLDEFTQLEQALSGSVAGDRVLNLLRREAWQNKLGNRAISATHESEFAAAITNLTGRDFNDLMEYLSPEQRQIALTAMNHSNQIRTSAIRTSEQFARDQQAYNLQMRQWKQQEAQRKKSDKEAKKKVQTKQDLLVSLLKEDPAKLVGNMNAIEGIRRVKEATAKVKDGKSLYDSLARYETERMFNFMSDGYIKTGRVPYTEMKLQLKNKEFRAKLKELNGENFVKEMDELTSVVDQLSDNFKETVVKFKDDPTTLNSILHIYSILGLAHGDVMTPLMAFTAKKSILRIGQRQYNMWSNKRNYDPEHVHKALNAARAAKKGNKESIRKTASQLGTPYSP